MRLAYCALVIANPNIVGVFRKGWPATDSDPRQAAGDRIVCALSRLGCPVA